MDTTHGDLRAKKLINVRSKKSWDQRSTPSFHYTQQLVQIEFSLEHLEAHHNSSYHQITNLASSILTTTTTKRYNENKERNSRFCHLRFSANIFQTTEEYCTKHGKNDFL